VDFFLESMIELGEPARDDDDMILVPDEYIEKCYGGAWPECGTRTINAAVQERFR